MYNVQVNEQGFYMGSYATVGTVKDGVAVTSLPPSENSLCYKLVDVKVQKEKQQPILQYTKMTESETEFDFYYFLTTEDEEGNEVETPITEEEYETLKETSSIQIEQSPKIVTIILNSEEYSALDDEEKENFIAAYKEDENGELVYETIIVTEIVKDWEFSQEKYDELMILKNQKEAEDEAAKAYQESISNKVLANRITELEESMVVTDAMTAAILEGVNEI